MAKAWSLFVALTVALAALVVVHPEARACAPAPPQGVDVSILAEQAVIVWDEAAKTQHFIRRADFSTEARSFGFLVPTPSKPTLESAPDAIFRALEDVTRPERREARRYEIAWTLCGGMFLGGDAPETAGAKAVEVLEEKTVAGWDAAILAADDPDALGAWLDENGYAFRKELRDWLASYVAARWVITAFKLSSGDQSRFGTEAVHMTFAADRPFFPYREPEGQPQAGGRTLRVFFLARERSNVYLAGARWPGQLLHAAPLAGYAGPALPGVGEGFWLHTFLDHSSPRPGHDDLFFAPAPGGEVREPPHVNWRTTTIPVFLDVIVFLLALAGLTIAIRRRRS